MGDTSSEKWGIQLVYFGGVCLTRHGYETEGEAIRECHRILDCSTSRPEVFYHRIARRPTDSGLLAGGGFYNTSRNQLQAVLWFREQIVPAQDPAPAEPAPAEPAPADPAAPDSTPPPPPDADPLTN